MKTDLEPWNITLEPWITIKTIKNRPGTLKNHKTWPRTMKNHKNWPRTMKNHPGWLQETPRRKWWFFVTNRHTLHHNIHITIITTITIVIKSIILQLHAGTEHFNTAMTNMDRLIKTAQDQVSLQQCWGWRGGPGGTRQSNWDLRSSPLQLSKKGRIRCGHYKSPTQRCRRSVAYFTLLPSWKLHLTKTVAAKSFMK